MAMTKRNRHVLSKEEPVLSKEEKIIIKIMEKYRPSSFEEMVERSGMKSDVVSTVIDMLLEKGMITEKIPLKT